LANTVTLQIKINDNGELQLLSSNAQKAAASTDKLAKSQEKAGHGAERHSKQQKGVAGATSNSTKAFSKMTTGITSGLVPAYAVLAANIFALTAAFGALRRASAFEQLEQGLIRVGNASGANLPYVASQIRDITGAAVSMEAAMSSTALAVSSGFSSTQLAELTKVAKGASQALGRDMEDALTRLVKGTAKLEPEILDELGIMVRLDDAVRTYAASIGKSDDQLTQFERRQAFLNATIEQGAKKFGDVADAIDPNAYDQLAASFADLTKQGLILVNNVLSPLITFLASTPTALAGAMLLFGSTILGTILPALDAVIVRQRKVATVMSKEMKISAAKGTSAFTEAASKINKLQFAPKSVKLLEKQMLKGSVRGKQLNTVLRNISKSEKLRAAAIMTTAPELLAVKQAELLGVQQLHAQVLALQKLETARGLTTVAAERAITTSRLASGQAAALSMMASAGAFKGFGIALASIGKGFKHVLRVAGGLGKLAAGATLAKNAVSLLGRAFLNAIPGIGQVLFFGSLLYPMFKGMFGGKGELTSKMDEITESFKSFGQIGQQLRETLEGDNTAAENFVATLKVQVGVLTQIKDGYARYGAAVKSTRLETLIETQREVTRQQKELDDATDKAGKSMTQFAGVGLIPLQQTLKKTKEKVLELRAGLNAIDKDAAVIITQAAIDNIKSSPTLLEKMGGKLVGLNKLLDDVRAGTVGTGQAFSDSLDEIMGQDASALASIESAKTAMGDFQSDVNKLASKASSPFDAVIDSSQKLANEFMQAGKSGGLGFQAFKDNAEGLQETIDRTRTLLDLPFVISDAGTIDVLSKKLAENRDTIITTAAKVKKQETAQKKLNSVSADNPIVMKRALELGESILDTKQKAIDAELQNYALLGTTEANSERIKVLNEETNSILAERLITGEKQANIDLASANQAKRLNDIAKSTFADKKAIFAIDQKMAKNALLRKAATTGKDITAQDELKFFNDNKARREKMIADEKSAKLATLDIEYNLLDAQLRLEKIKASRAGATAAELAVFTEIATLYSSGKKMASDLIGKEATGATDDLTTEGLQSQRAALNASRTATGTIGERVQAAGEKGGGGALDPKATMATIGDKTAAAVNAMQPMMDLMGPEGALINSVAQGAIAITDAWSTAFKTMGDDGKISMGAAMEAASATLGALGGMLAQASADRIAGVDDEIAAEQKRDGQSAASVAKIKKLEAKKEAMKKKAFETDKKVKMAQTIMNTAAGIMHWNSEGNLPMAIATGIMGAIQLATIASTSYKGSGSSAPSGEMAAVSMGNRENTVDLARGNSASGELGYMRGEAGQGTGATNFKPSSAFTGAKYRASGGETAGFMVGEQGPEMFIPDRSGRIAPADETASMGTTSNVNFNISAVDAAGVEDVLVRQKGHIIRMIREAANEHGQPFLEDISDGSYTS
jgi:hypothetical protein